MSRPRVLLLACGNPSRGDDAIGPLLAERAEALAAAPDAAADLDCLTVFQFQVEHALDFRGRELVLLADASAAAPSPFRFFRAATEERPVHTSHAATPGLLLAAYRQAVGGAPPPVFVLAVRGERFDLGAPLSPAGERHLASAADFVAGLLAAPWAAAWEHRAQA